MVIATLLAVSVFLLSACSSVACLSGLCPSSKEVASKIPWEPTALAHQSCPDISGKYKAIDTNNTKSWQGLIGEFPMTNDELNSIHATYTEPRKIPGRIISRPTQKDPNATVWDQSEFFDNAIVYIEQTDEQLVVSLIDNTGKLYKRQSIDLRSPMIGCDGKDFIIRQITMTGSNEASSTGLALARENRFKKLADGSLQLIQHDRWWDRDMALGLTRLLKNIKFTSIYLIQ